MKYSLICILYNPNSTRDSRTRARELASKLHNALPDMKVRVRASKRRGHMESMAFWTALRTRRPLIIAVSGDGGYSEVVNGAMRAAALGRRAAVGLLPAGNANDAYANGHRGDLVARIIGGDEDRVDVLRLTGSVHGRRTVRYGHSYIGIGITPQAGERLNGVRLNLWQELRIVAGVLLHPKSVKLLVDGELRRYDSLVFSNVGRMSKVIRVPGYRGNADGAFEVSHLYSRNKLKLARDLMHAALRGLPTDETTDRFDFETLRPLTLQIDGEIVRLDAGTSARVDIRHRALRIIV